MKEELGFLGNDGYKLRFDDISEIVVASLIASLLTDVSSNGQIKVNFSLHLLFPTYSSIKALNLYLENKCVLVKSRMSENITDAVNFLLGGNNESLKSVGSKENAIQFFNEWLGNKISLLKEGDRLELKPCIVDFHITNSKKNNVLHEYEILLEPKKFLKTQKKNLRNHIEILESLHSEMAASIEFSSSHISYRKILEFSNSFLDEKYKLTGTTKFSFDIREIKFRHALGTIENDKQRLSLPQPFTVGATERILLPFFMESLALLDINSIKIISPPVEINNIELLFHITRPAIKNLYQSKSKGLSPKKRSKLDESEVLIFENYYSILTSRVSFLGRPKLEKAYCELFYWLLNKASYCLEEPTFLKMKAAKWLDDNKGKNYIQMEDQFLLPFLHERLVEEFGGKIKKKQEQFGGNVDLSFEGIPIELKVRKGMKHSLTEIIKEKYKPLSQAATYAAKNRLGFVVVLDLPDQENNNTNLDSCFQVFEKEFDGNLNTQIIVCVFYCNLPIPSLAKN